MGREKRKIGDEEMGKAAQVESQRFLRVTELAEMLQCSESHAYKIMRMLNNELKKKGKIVVAGRVPKRYVEERVSF